MKVYTTLLNLVFRTIIVLSIFYLLFFYMSYDIIRLILHYHSHFGPLKGIPLNINNYYLMPSVILLACQNFIVPI